MALIARLWHFIPPIVRRVHLSWWATFAAVWMVDRSPTRAVALAALASCIVIPLFMIFDRPDTLDIEELT